MSDLNDNESARRRYARMVVFGGVLALAGAGVLVRIYDGERASNLLFALAFSLWLGHAVGTVRRGMRA